MCFFRPLDPEKDLQHHVDKHEAMEVLLDFGLLQHPGLPAHALVQVAQVGY
jgi:hypothetical protein